VEHLTPIIRLYDNLIVPLQGTMSDDSVCRLREDVTARIGVESAYGLILDLSALAFMDSFVTRVVRDLALIARLMGVSTVVCGLSPDIAVTLTDMGLDLPGVMTALNLERAIEALFRMRDEDARELRLTLGAA
jgi:rsbT antagonist protein RsbS